MNAAQRVNAVSGIVKVALSSGIVVTFRPGLAGEAAAAGLLPTDAPMTSQMSPEELEIYTENIVDKAEPLILACGVDPVWVHGEGSPNDGTASYSLLETDDIIQCFIAIMDGASDAANALNEQFPQAERDQKTIAVVARAFGMNPLDIEKMTLPEWIRLLRYAKLCGSVKEGTPK